MIRTKSCIGLFLVLVINLMITGCGSTVKTLILEYTDASKTSELLKQKESNKDNNTKDVATKSSKGQESSKSKKNKGSKALVVYFSRTGEQYSVGVIDKGNTAIVADMISKKIGADLFELIPRDGHYPMTYSELTDVAKKEQNENARPEYEGEIPNLSQYDTIFIGGPVWWGDWPMIMYTFFEKNKTELDKKTLIPFSTHEGSGLSGFDKKLRSIFPNATIGKGLAIRGNDCQKNQDDVRNSVNEWLSELGH